MAIPRCLLKWRQQPRRAGRSGGTTRHQIVAEHSTPMLLVVLPMTMREHVSKMPCPACGKELESDARFCRHCGRAVAKVAEPAPSEPAPSEPPAGRVAGRERKIATLLVEQKLSIAMDIADRVYVMGHGHVVFEGTPEELRARDDVRKEWLEV